MPALVTILAAYLLGSVSFAALLVRWRAGVDLRTVGSGNLGATNAGRVLGKRGAIAVYVLDFFKGAIPVAAWRMLGDGAFEIGFLAGIAAVVGHCFPIWHGFRGGKGVATASGVILATTPLGFAITAASFALVAFTTRMISAGSIVAAIVAPISWAATDARSVDVMPRWIITGTLVALAILVIVRHRTNLSRILAGTESRF